MVVGAVTCPSNRGENSLPLSSVHTVALLSHANLDSACETAFEDEVVLDVVDELTVTEPLVVGLDSESGNKRIIKYYIFILNITLLKRVCNMTQCTNQRLLTIKHHTHSFFLTHSCIVTQCTFIRHKGCTNNDSS